MWLKCGTKIINEINKVKKSTLFFGWFIYAVIDIDVGSRRHRCLGACTQRSSVQPRSSYPGCWKGQIHACAADLGACSSTLKKPMVQQLDGGLVRTDPLGHAIQLPSSQISIGCQQLGASHGIACGFFAGVRSHIPNVLHASLLIHDANSDGHGVHVHAAHACDWRFDTGVAVIVLDPTK
jgi:hypothetical protein